MYQTALIKMFPTGETDLSECLLFLLIFIGLIYRLLDVLEKQKVEDCFAKAKVVIG